MNGNGNSNGVIGLRLDLVFPFRIHEFTDSRAVLPLILISKIFATPQRIAIPGRFRFFRKPAGIHKMHGMKNMKAEAFRACCPIVNLRVFLFGICLGWSYTGSNGMETSHDGTPTTD